MGSQSRLDSLEQPFAGEVVPSITTADTAPACAGSWDYNGDYWRCPCGASNTTGKCPEGR